MIDSCALILCHDIKKTDLGYELSEQTRERTDVGIKLLKKGKVKKLVMSGGCEHLYSVYISKVMKEYALEKGIKSNEILEENLSRDTVGQLVFSKLGIINPLGIKSVVIVTNQYHMERVMVEARFIFGKGYDTSFIIAPGNDNRRTSEEERRSLEQFLDSFKGITPGDDDAILNRLLEKHPYYSKDPGEFRKRLEKLKKFN